MVSELLHNEYTNPYWALWQISLGSMAGLCCVVFMGLKFKWFRAQLKLGDSPSSHVASVPVQGVGFKLKANPDDFQLFKVTSEFAPITKQNQQQNGSQNKNYMSKTPITSKAVSQTMNSNKSTTMTQDSSKPIPQSTTSNANKSTNMTQVQSKPASQSSNSNTSSNATNTNTTMPKQESNISETDSKVNIPKEQLSRKEDSQTTKPQPILKKQVPAEKIPTEIQIKKSAVNFEEHHTEISNPSPQKYSDLINKPLKQNTLTKTIDDEEYKQQKIKEPYKKPEQMKKQQQTNINNVAKQPMFQTRNPLASHNFVMPMENEDDWKIQIVDEKTKMQPKEENMNELYKTPTNSNMYSSQAANIFFGGNVPVAQPRPRKFVEMEEDTFSMGSNTSA